MPVARELRTGPRVYDGAVGAVEDSVIIGQVKSALIADSSDQGLADRSRNISGYRAAERIRGQRRSASSRHDVAGDVDGVDDVKKTLELRSKN